MHLDATGSIETRRAIPIGASDVDSRLTYRLAFFALVRELCGVVQDQNRPAGCCRSLSRALKMSRENLSFIVSIVVQRTIGSFGIGPVLTYHRDGAPGLAEAVQAVFVSEGRVAKFPVDPALTRVLVGDSALSARSNRLLRHVARVEVAHGHIISHELDNDARISVNPLIFMEYLWVIESASYRLRSKTGGDQTLMNTRLQRPGGYSLTSTLRVVGKLVREHSYQKARIRAATVDYASRRLRAADDMRVASLGHRAKIFEYHITAGALRQAVADLLLADDPPVIFRESVDLRIGNLNGFDPHASSVEKRRAPLIPYHRLPHPAVAAGAYAQLPGALQQRPAVRGPASSPTHVSTLDESGPRQN